MGSDIVRHAAGDRRCRRAVGLVTRIGRVVVAAGLLVAPVQLSAVPSAAGQEGIVGAWEAQSYLLSTGEEHPLIGTIFFTAADWQVVFFVLDADGAVRRGSAEGGTYATQGDSLTFMHRFNLSAGEALPGLPAADLRMTVNETMAAEAARYSIDQDKLTLYFPSGNEIRFRRSP